MTLRNHFVIVYVTDHIPFVTYFPLYTHHSLRWSFLFHLIPSLNTTTIPGLNILKARLHLTLLIGSNVQLESWRKRKRLSLMNLNE